MKCTLCNAQTLSKWYEDKRRPYILCENCSLIFVPRNFLISAEKEKARYDTHQNSEADIRYLEYLTKIASGISPYIVKGQTGLDFGCGASTMLSDILVKMGFVMDSYDLYYHPDQDIWHKKFDFIILSEVIEHLADPKDVMMRLKTMLKPQGQFFIKTKFYPEDQTAFDKWFYKNDPTHVQFFSDKSMSILAKFLDMQGPQLLKSEDLYRIWS